MSDSEYNDYMRSRPPSQGEDAAFGGGIPDQPSQRRQRQRLGATADYEGRKPRFEALTSPHTPSRDPEYGDYMHSRLPSQGDGSIEEADFPFGGSYFDTKNIQNLNSTSFDGFVKGLEKAFIMFYNPEIPGNTGPKTEFTMAADRPRKYNHAYAAVDCSLERDLCMREHVSKLPVFKLYSNGFDLNTIRHAEDFTARQMQMLIMMTPVLRAPKGNIGAISWNP